MSDPVCTFAQHYRGRHRPEDALWWLRYPGSTGPSGAPPVQQRFLEAADELADHGHHDAAAALLEVLADLLASDRRSALDALEHVRVEG